MPQQSSGAGTGEREEFLEALYKQFLCRWETGEELSIEAYGRENPAVASELGGLHRMRIEDLMVGYLEQQAGEPGSDFEAYCAQHPAHARGCVRCRRAWPWSMASSTSSWKTTPSPT